MYSYYINPKIIFDVIHVYKFSVFIIYVMYSKHTNINIKLYVNRTFTFQNLSIQIFTYMRFTKSRGPIGVIFKYLCIVSKQAQISNLVWPGRFMVP